jgi:hypothetical protein
LLLLYSFSLKIEKEQEQEEGKQLEEIKEGNLFSNDLTLTSL